MYSIHSNCYLLAHFRATTRINANVSIFFGKSAIHLHFLANHECSFVILQCSGHSCWRPNYHWIVSLDHLLQMNRCAISLQVSTLTGYLSSPTIVWNFWIPVQLDAFWPLWKTPTSSSPKMPCLFLKLTPLQILGALTRSSLEACPFIKIILPFKQVS